MEERIFELTEPCASYIEPINALLAQLSSSPIVFTMEELCAIVESPASHLFLIEHNGQLQGMLTLCNYLVPTGRKYWIEDVVVDAAARGKSYGRRLVEYAIEYARECGKGSLLLTSKPARIAANALYRSAGFSPKETNVYTMKIGD